MTRSQRSVLPLFVFAVTSYFVSDALLARAMANLKPPAVREAHLELLATPGAPSPEPAPPPPLSVPGFDPGMFP